MSNTRKIRKTDAEKAYSVSRYAEEAHIDPFPLVVDDETTIEIEAPNGEALNLFGRAANTGDVDTMLLAVLGDSYTPVTDIFKKLPYKATMSLLDDLMEHFGLDSGAEVQLVGPNGAKVTESDPQQVAALMAQGWRLGK